MERLPMSPKREETILLGFGKRLRGLREAANLSQESFADISGLDRTYVGGVERGERNISLVNLHRISTALGISLQELFRGVTK
jgi:transcriptional regulator with XRE-family HTH domain